MPEEWIKGETLHIGRHSVTVHYPVLTPTEKLRREQQVKNAMVALMREQIHKEARNHAEQHQPNR